MKKEAVFIASIFIFMFATNYISAANCTNRDPIITSCECNGITRTSGYCCYYSVNPTINITYQSTQECGYTEVSPHWQNILVFKDDYRYSPASTAATESEWNIKHFDMTDIDRYKYVDNTTFNPKLQTIVYMLDMTMLQDLDLNGEIASWQYYATTHPDAESVFMHYAEDTVIGNTTFQGCPVTPVPSCRVIFFQGNDMRYMINPNSPAANSFYTWFWNNLTTTPNQYGHYHSGVFLDEHAPYPPSIGTPTSGGKLLEYGMRADDPRFAPMYQQNMTNFLAAQRTGSNPGTIVMPNIANWMSEQSLWDQSFAASGMFAEFILNPDTLKDSFTILWDKTKQLNAQGKYAVYSTHVRLDHVPPELFPTYKNYTTGSYATVGDREKIMELAAYYMGKDPANKLTYFNILGCYGWATNEQPNWNYTYCWTKAIETDIGQPISDYYVLSSGTDVSGYYQIYARNFTKAWVIFKPRGDWQYDIYNDSTATVVHLPQIMTPIDGSGNPMTPTNQFTLRSSEAAILLKQGQTPSNPSSDINSDGKVNIIDLAISVFNQGRNPLSPSYSNLDLNQDGKIDFDDVRIVINNIL
jgi:hypothetical protein